MRILQVITSLYTGGAESLVVNLILRMQAKGHIVDLVVFNGYETPLMEKLRYISWEVGYIILYIS